MDDTESLDLEEGTWAYIPGNWDHEEIHKAYQMDPEIPQDSITFSMLDKQGKKTLPRTLLADHEKNVFEMTEQAGHESKAPDMTQCNPIRFVNIRFMSTNCKALTRDHVADHRFIIMLSVRRWEDAEIPEECYIHNHFIQPDSAEHCLDILNFLHYHVFQFLQKETEQENPVVVLKYIQPQLYNECKTQVHWRKFRKTWLEDRIVAFDPECIVFYGKPFDDAHEPRDRMFFWTEQFRKTICKVSYVKNAKRFLLQSLYMYITLDYDELGGPAMQEQLQQSKCIPSAAYREPKTMYIELTRKPPTPEPQVVPVELEEEDAEKLDQFEKELNEGLFKNTDDQSQILWNNLRPSLEQALINEELGDGPEKELDCDPNSVDSLLEVIPRIENELFRNVDYKKALAMTIAMKEKFSMSKVERLRKLLEDSPVDILHRIHARGNVSGKRTLKRGPSLEEEIMQREDDEEEEDMEED